MKPNHEGALPAVLHPEQRLNYPQVMVLTGWGRTRIAERVKTGDFPPPEREGRRCTRWRAGDVLDYLAKRRDQLRIVRAPAARAEQPATEAA